VRTGPRASSSAGLKSQHSIRHLICTSPSLVLPQVVVAEVHGDLLSSNGVSQSLEEIFPGSVSYVSSTGRPRPAAPSGTGVRLSRQWLVRFTTSLCFRTLIDPPPTYLAHRCLTRFLFPQCSRASNLHSNPALVPTPFPIDACRYDVLLLSSPDQVFETSQTRSSVREIGRSDVPRKKRSRLHAFQVGRSAGVEEGGLRTTISRSHGSSTFLGRAFFSIPDFPQD